MSTYRKKLILEHFDLEVNIQIFDLNRYFSTKEESLQYTEDLGGISIFHKNLEKSFLIPYENRFDFEIFLNSGLIEDIPAQYKQSNKKIGFNHVIFTK